MGAEELYLAHTRSTYHSTTQNGAPKLLILTSERRCENLFIVSYRKRNTYSIFDTLTFDGLEEKKI